MPSAFTHAIAAVALGSFLPKTADRPRLWVAGAVCAALPDLDVLGFPLGIRYGDLLGHRGLSHSLLFAAALAAAIALAWPRASLGRWGIWLYLFLATASHGLLDALTDGGLGVALLSPFDTHRYFFPWRPIAVSPIGVGRFFSSRGLAVLASEVQWVWVPSALLALAGWAWRRRRA